MNKYNNIIHWLMFLLVLGISGTAIMNQTFYSKEAIMDTFEFSMPMVGIADMGFADKLFIARIERRIGWEWHFWMGTALFALVFIRVILQIRSKKKFNSLQMIMYTALSIFFITGIPLFVRTYIDVSMDIQDLSRAIHYWSGWIFLVLLVSHIAMIIKRENNGERGLISSMFNFTKKNKDKLGLILAATLSFSATSSYASKSANYNEALKYLNGEKGVLIIEKIMPNCPYDNCKMAEKQQNEEHIDLDNNNKIFKVKEIDYFTAYGFLEKAINEDKSVEAAEKYTQIFLKNVNYKDKRIDKILIEKTEELFKEDFEKLLELQIKSFSLFGNSKDCKSIFTYAEILEKGLLKQKKNKEKAKEMYINATKECAKSSMQHMMASMKQKQL